MTLFKENPKLTENLEAARKQIAETQKSAKEQANRDAESIRLLQDNLEARLIEIQAVDKELLGKLFFQILPLLPIFAFRLIFCYRLLQTQQLPSPQASRTCST